MLSPPTKASHAKSSTDNKTLDIHPLTAGEVADTANTRSFALPAAPSACLAATRRERSAMIYDQTGNGNHMLPATPAANPHYDLPVNATRHSITVGGHKVTVLIPGRHRLQVLRGWPPVTIPKRYTWSQVASITTICAGECVCFANRFLAHAVPKRMMIRLASTTATPRMTAITTKRKGCMEAVYFGSGMVVTAKALDRVSRLAIAHRLPDLFSLLQFQRRLGGRDLRRHVRERLGSLLRLRDRDDQGRDKRLRYQGRCHTKSGSTSTARSNGYQPMTKTGGIILGVGGDNMARASARERQ